MFCFFCSISIKEFIINLLIKLNTRHISKKQGIATYRSVWLGELLTRSAKDEF